MKYYISRLRDITQKKNPENKRLSRGDEIQLGEKNEKQNAIPWL
jgi:hypothetical protein